MSEAEGQVERHVIGVVESRKDAEVSYVSDVHDETGKGPGFEGVSGRG